MTLIPIESLDDPRLDVYRDVKAVRHPRWQGRFVAEGSRLVKRLLASDFTIESVMISDGRYEEFQQWLPPEVPVYELPRVLVADLVGYNFHCGAMACALRKPSLQLDDIASQFGEQTTLIVCPDVNDPENIGTLIRLGAAFGIDAILLGSACADPFSRRVLRVSMGNALTLSIIQSRDLRSDLLRLKSEWGVQLAATVVETLDPTDEGTQQSINKAALAKSHVETLAHATRRPRLALLFGNEAQGLGSEWLELCDRRLTIPMQDADSLNVAVAAGIFLYHFTSAATVEP